METIEDLYREHARAVFALLLSFDRTLAEDLMQDTFVKATRSLAGFRGGNPRSWLFTIARSVFIDHTRRRLPTVAEEVEVPATRAPAVEERVLIQAVLAGLPDRQRIALLLVDHAGMSYAEMAEAVGASPAAAKALLHRARVSFRASYQEMNA